MTTLKSNALPNTVEITAHRISETIYIDDINYEVPTEGISIPREEFAQAVRDLGFVVIDEKELPKVVVAEDDDKFVEVNGDAWEIEDIPDDVVYLKKQVLRDLAIIAWAEANPPKPPIDPAKVEALADLISTIGGSTLGGGTTPLPIDFATRLLATGRIEIKEEN